MADFEQPSAWVARFAALIPAGEVLDLACGRGRHARLLAKGGHSVTAVDRDAAALADACGAGIATMQIDLEDGISPWPFEAARFSGIVVTNYLHRPLFPHLLASLAGGGVLIYETFAQGNEYFGKPSNPEFLLRAGELLNLVQAGGPDPMRIIAFEDGYVGAPWPAMVQRICAAKIGSAALPDQPRLDSIAP